MGLSDTAPTCVKRDPPKTPEQCAVIVLAEYEYWREHQDPTIGDTAMGGMAAAANIYAAIKMGMMAPWHPK